jgi:stage III sporulation protein AG
MDGTIKKLTQFVSKYRFAVLILLIGVILMLLPTGKNSERPESEHVTVEQAMDPAEQLTQILGQIRGVGKVQVMLSVQTGQTTVYQKDDENTVIITDDNRAQSGLVQRVEYPVYRGAVIVCQGADDPAVRLSVVEAVTNVTGLSAARITVLKMK